MRDYTLALRRTELRKAAAVRKDLQFRTIRLMSFAAVFLLPVFIYNGFPDIRIIWSVVSALPPAALFLYSVIRSMSVRDLIRLCDMQMAEYKAALVRGTPDWPDLLPADMPEGISADHPYASDLDITGRYSVFQYLDRTGTPGGRKYLHEFLLNLNSLPAGHGDEMRQRVKLLSRKRVLMQRFRRKARFVTEKMTEKRGEALHSRIFADRAVPPSPGFLIPVSVILTAVTSVTVVFSAWPSMPPLFFFSLPLQILLFVYVHFRTTPVAVKISRTAEESLLYAELCRTAEKDRDLHSYYPLFAGKPSVILKQYASIASWYALRLNPLFYAAAGILLQHELWLNRRLRQWYNTLRPETAAVAESVARLDAELCFAQFAMDHPDYVYPEYAESEKRFTEAEDLTHILLPSSTRKGNSFTFGSDESLWILTGSNMSGKSTFMRTLAVSLLLAEAGLPLPAAKFIYTPFRVYSSMRIRDDMERSVSGFYGEIRRIRQLLDSLKDSAQEKPVFYLIDEMFRGTNTRERIIAAESVIRTLLTTVSSGIISTHDQELTALCSTRPEVRCMHFEENIKDGIMYFDYRLREGPVRSSNALRILELEGIPVYYA